MSGTDTSAPETVLPAADTALDRPARAFDRIVRTSDAYRAQLRTTIHRMGLSGRKRTLLVLGCGSGAPVQGVVDEAPGWKVVAVDESAELVGMARRLDWAPDYRFLHGTLGTLDDALRAEGIEPRFDGILVVFQMRHQRNLDDTLDYLLELLEPGAPLAVHEYSVRGNRAARARWTAACWLDYLPRVRMRGRVPGMVSFLWNSVVRFDSITTFKERLEVAGFTDVRVQTVGGWQEHVLHTVLGRKPEDEVDAPLDELDAEDSDHTGTWTDRGTETPPIASAPVPAPRPSPTDRPEWGPASPRDETAGRDDRGGGGRGHDRAGRGDVFDLDEEEDETGYGAREGDPDADADADGPTSYADMDEFEDNHDLDGTQYRDDPDETVLFTHADPDAETPPTGLPVVDGEEREAGRQSEPESAEREPHSETVEPQAKKEPQGEDEPQVDASEGVPQTRDEPRAEKEPQVAASEAEPGQEAPRGAATRRVRNLFRAPHRSSAPAGPPGSPWLRRSEREAVRGEDDEG